MSIREGGVEIGFMSFYVKPTTAEGDFLSPTFL